MALLFNKNGLVAFDPWQQVATEEELVAATRNERQHILLPLPMWHVHAIRVAAQGHAVGVSLGPEDEPVELMSAVDALPLIAIHFPKFTDGRGYSQAKILRERYGYSGDLRAMGDILRDLIYLLNKCGFSSFALRDDQDPNEAQAAFDDYSWTPMVGG